MTKNKVANFKRKK